MRKTIAEALWYVGAGRAEIRSEPLPRPSDGDNTLLVKSLYSAWSRGTESLVCAGKVPKGEWQRMRAPFQEGDFPFPVKYGYINVGQVEEGPSEWQGKRVFALYPHQNLYWASPDSLAVLPSELPSKRALLTANMETALNGLWDSRVGPGDRVVVVGAGVVGLLLASLLSKIPGIELLVVDPFAGRKEVSEKIGARYEGSLPDSWRGRADCAFHCSGQGAGLQSALSACGKEARVVDLSWYGESTQSLRLGAEFHSQRLSIISSQVGSLPPWRAPRWDYKRRLAKAMELLGDTRLDHLLEEEIAFSDAPGKISEGLLQDVGILCQPIAYSI